MVDKDLQFALSGVNPTHFVIFVDKVRDRV